MSGAAGGAGGGADGRRGFLRRAYAGAGALFAALFGLPALAAAIDPALRRAAGAWTDAGPADAVVEGQAVRFTYVVDAGWERRKEVAYLVRRGGDVLALSARCTHLGCSVAFAGGEFRCPCHNGVFDGGGAPRRGPVREPLQRLELRVENGRVRVRG